MQSTYMPDRAMTMRFLHTLRLVASFALLGAVVMGSLLGWMENPFDPRAVGAGAGGIIAVIAKVSHVI